MAGTKFVVQMLLFLMENDLTLYDVPSRRTRLRHFPNYFCIVGYHSWKTLEENKYINVCFIFSCKWDLALDTRGIMQYWAALLVIILHEMSHIISRWFLNFRFHWTLILFSILFCNLYLFIDLYICCFWFDKLNVKLICEINIYMNELVLHF
jgi:hypothetical protein